jgi:hypothetical protein
MKTWPHGIVITVLFTLAIGMWGWSPNQLKAETVEIPQFKYDPFWPKPLPEGWVLGSVGSVCVDARDHVFVVTRGEPAPKERNLAMPAPPVIEFDAEGNVVNSWGNRDLMAKTRTVASSTWTATFGLQATMTGLFRNIPMTAAKCCCR